MILLDFLEFCGILLQTFGTPLNSFVFHGNLWDSMRMFGVLCGSIGITLEFYGFFGILFYRFGLCFVFFETLLGYMEIYGILRNVWFLWDSFGVFGTFLDAAGFRFFLFCGFSSKSLCCMYVAD